MIFCGVFDGHGPDGHKVSQYVRDNLPSKLSAALEASQLNRSKDADEDYDDDDDNDNNDNSMDNKYYLNHANSQKLSLSSWESNFVKSFKETDTKLSQETSIDSYCSGSTGVTIVKQVLLKTQRHMIFFHLKQREFILRLRFYFWIYML